jgi:hypothetical protein
MDILSFNKVNKGDEKMRPNYGKQREFWNESARDQEAGMSEKDSSNILPSVIIFLAIIGIVLGAIFIF